MLKRFGVVLGVVLGVLSFAQSVALAQTNEYAARYEGIPFSKTDDGAFILGNPDAPLTMVEFADFICPHCQNYQEVVHQFIETYVASGQARFEYRMFPIVDPKLSPLTAQLAYCADEQKDGTFWPAHDALYDLAIARQVNEDTYKVLADITGVDADKLNFCTERANQHEIDTELAQSLGISGTPAVMFRLEDGTLGWPFVEGQLFNRGGAPWVVLQEVMSATDIAEVVYVPQSLLQGLVNVDTTCATPCWATFTPGISLWKDLVDAIQNNAFFMDVEVGEDPNSEAAVIQWRSIDSQLDATNRAYTEDGTTVAQISVIELSPFSVSEIIEAQGDPLYALGSLSGENQALLNLFYPEKALVVTIYVIESLTENSQVIGAYYLSEETMQQIIESTPLVDWTGYEGYQGYLTEE